MPEDFHFQQPLWFALLVPLALLLWRLRHAGDSRAAAIWRRACEPHLLPHLLRTQGGQRARLPLGGLALAWLLAVTALADPVWQQRAQPVFRNQAALMLVLDLSRSMLSPDLPPSRLERARLKLAEILKRRREGQTGLVVFAGDAFAVAPLTSDNDTILALLQSLHPGLMPTQDSRADRGIALAAERLRQAGARHGDMLLIGDGYSDASILPLAQTLRRQGYRLSVLAVGTDRPAPIPDKRGRPARDRGGKVILPVLDEDSLRRLARAGGGRYHRITADDRDLDRLLPAVGRLDVGTDPDSPLAGAWQSRGPWLLPLLLVLAAGAFRRGWLLGPLLPPALALLGGLAAPAPAQAAGWTDLWLRQEQQAAQALHAGDFTRAQQLARDPRRKAEAAYRKGDLETALALYAGLEDAEAHFNRGNTLARLQRFDEALAAYEQALTLSPGLKDAAYNRDLLKKMLDSKAREGEGEASEEAARKQGKQAGEGEGGSPDPDAERSEAGQQGNAGADDDSGPQPDRADQDPGEQAGSETDQGPAKEESGSQQARQAPEDTPEQPETPPETPAPNDEAPPDPANREQAQADERQLRRIPDDPGGLMRRKFLYQYRKRALREQPVGPQGQGW